MRVYLGIGHGGVDAGAVANGFKEKDLNLSVGMHCYNALIANGVNCMISRTSDVSENQTERVKECNEFNADYAIDIHHNAGGGNGFEIFHHFGGGKGEIISHNIEKEVLAIGQNSRGCKTKVGSSGKDYYAFIRETKCPAVIAECAFIDNKQDIEIVSTEAKRKIFGTALAKGILKTLGVEYKEPVEEEPKAELYRVQVGAFAKKENAEEVLSRLKSVGFDGFIK